MNRSKAILIAFDQLFNAMCGGWPDETLSSRAWRWHRDGVRSWPRRLIDALFCWDKNHCMESFRSEKLRLQCPVEMRPKSEVPHV